MKKKCLAIGIILLFIGVVVAPSINQSIVTASQDDDLVEVTTQACGIQGYDDTTVKLTRQQYQDLEQYLVKFRARLNKTTTREEAIPIFKEAVVELDKYGLLPLGMSVERVQKLITGYYENKNILKLQEKLLQGCLPTSGGGWNYLCLITGEADACRSVGPFGFGLYIFLKSLIALTGSGMDGLGLFIILAMWMLSELKISNFLGILTFGSRGYLSADYPSHGYVYTFGSRGVQIINNTFFGGLFRMFDVVGQWECTGATGFFGIKLIDSDRKTSFFIGSALRVVLVPD